MDNRCKEKGCRRRVPQGKSLVSYACRKLGYCRYCYRMKFPARGGWQLMPLRTGEERFLSRGERLRCEEHAFEGMEALLWSPEFYAEWREYIEARKRGEL